MVITKNCFDQVGVEVLIKLHESAQICILVFLDHDLDAHGEVRYLDRTQTWV